MVLTLLDQILSGLLLTGTKRDGGHAGVHSDFTSVLVPGSIRIRSRGKHENKRSNVGGVTEASTKGEWWWVNVLLANLLNNEVLHSLCDGISSDSLEQYNLLESVKRSTPVSGKDFFLRLGRIEDLLELLVVLSEVLNNTLETRQVSLHDEEHTVGLNPFEIT